MTAEVHKGLPGSFTGCRLPGAPVPHTLSEAHSSWTDGSPLSSSQYGPMVCRGCVLGDAAHSPPDRLPSNPRLEGSRKQVTVSARCPPCRSVRAPPPTRPRSRWDSAQESTGQSEDTSAWPAGRHHHWGLRPSPGGSRGGAASQRPMSPPSRAFTMPSSEPLGRSVCKTERRGGRPVGSAAPRPSPAGSPHGHR